MGEVIDAIEPIRDDRYPDLSTWRMAGNDLWAIRRRALKIAAEHDVEVVALGAPALDLERVFSTYTEGRTQESEEAAR